MCVRTEIHSGWIGSRVILQSHGKRTTHGESGKYRHRHPTYQNFSKQVDQQRSQQIELHQHRHEPQMTEHVWIHLREIAGATADGIPVVTTQHSRHYLIFNVHQHVLVDEPCQRYGDGNHQNQRRVYSAQTPEVIFLETYSLAGINMIQQRRENQKT